MGFLGVGETLSGRYTASEYAPAGVPSPDGITFNHELREKRARVLAMDEGVRHELTHDDVTRIDTYVAVERERIRQPLHAEVMQLSIRIDQVRGNHKPIVVTVGVDPAQNRVGTVHGAHAHYGLVPTQKHYGSQIEALLAGLEVLGLESRSSEELVIGKADPRMAGPVCAHQASRTVEDGHVEIVLCDMRVDSLFRVEVLLTYVHGRDLIVALEPDVHIGHSVIDHAFKAVDARPHGNPYVDDAPALDGGVCDLQARRGVEQGWVAGHVHDVPLDADHRLLVHALDAAVVVDAEKDVPPWRLANEHTVSNVSFSGTAPHLLNSTDSPSPCSSISAMP